MSNAQVVPEEVKAAVEWQYRQKPQTMMSLAGERRTHRPLAIFDMPRHGFVVVDFERVLGSKSSRFYSTIPGEEHAEYKLGDRRRAKKNGSFTCYWSPEAACRAPALLDFHAAATSEAGRLLLELVLMPGDAVLVVRPPLPILRGSAVPMTAPPCSTRAVQSALATPNVARG